jgi:hypothetical protein
MGIRNKVTKDGFVSTLVDGTTGFFGIEQQVISSGSGSVETGLVVLSGSGVTAVLPDISTTAAIDGTVADGLVVKFVVASANTFFLTASDPINGGAWTRVLNAKQWDVVEAVGVTGLHSSLPVGWAVNLPVSGSVT